MYANNPIIASWNARWNDTKLAIATGGSYNDIAHDIVGYCGDSISSLSLTVKEAGKGEAVTNALAVLNKEYPLGISRHDIVEHIKKTKDNNLNTNNLDEVAKLQKGFPKRPKAIEIFRSALKL